MWCFKPLVLALCCHPYFRQVPQKIKPKKIIDICSFRLGFLWGRRISLISVASLLKKQTLTWCSVEDACGNGVPIISCWSEMSQGIFAVSGLEGSRFQSEHAVSGASQGRVPLPYSIFLHLCHESRRISSQTLEISGAWAGWGCEKQERNQHCSLKPGVGSHTTQNLSCLVVSRYCPRKKIQN